MSEHRAFDQEQARLRKAWVSTRAGDICCWELEAADSERIVSLSVRPEIAGGGLDRGEAILWQIALCCRRGEEPGAARVWPDEEAHKIRTLPESIFRPLLAKVNEVNGESPTELELLRDFTAATGAPASSE